MSTSKSRAFTLVELLVVVAIIGALIAILVPSLGKVKRRANTTRCLANVRSMAMGVQYYLADYKRMINFTGNSGDSWTQLLAKGGTTGYGFSEKVRLCPEATTTVSGDPAVQPWWGTSHDAWGNSAETGNDPITGKPYSASYGLNAFIYAPNSSQLGSIGIAVKSAYSLPVRAFDARIPVFSDCQWRHVAPKPGDNPGANLQNPGPQIVTALPMNMLMLDRHERAINVSFADGHADTVKLPDLYGLYWSKDWVPRNPLPAFPAY